MSKVKAAFTDDLSMSTNERILRDCHNLYTDPKDGLVLIARDVGISLLVPRKKINVLLIGNHSAGKSSFINWYIEESVQRTGVAIETQGFTLVTSGKKRESLTGNATLHLYPPLEPLNKIEGAIDYLCTEISTSKQKQFSLLTLIDTPGLVDGDMKYPFDVNEAILWFGDISDLVFVFFDPIGQALCKRTLNIVEKLNEKHGERIKFFLSKADEAGADADRQRVMMQIVQELCKRPGLNKAGFDMLTIYVPTLQEKKTRCVNQIDDVCKQVEKTIKQTIQNTLNSLEKDTELIIQTIDDKLKKDSETRAKNMNRTLKSTFFMFVSFLVFFIAIMSKLPINTLKSVMGREATIFLETNILLPYRQVKELVPLEYESYYFIATVFIGLLFVLISKFMNRKKPTMTNKEKKLMNERREYLNNFIKNKKKKLYDEYLQQAVIDFEESR